MADESGVSCDKSHLSPEEQLKGLFTLDENGNVAVRTFAVVGCDDDIPCDFSHLSLMQLLTLAIGTSDCGKPALRLATPA